MLFLGFLEFLFPCSLQIADDEVEGWVVKAITAKLLDCKIDQMNQIIIVRCIIAISCYLHALENNLILSSDCVDF